VKKLKIRFHKDLYPAIAIKKVIADFRRVTPVEIKEKKDYYLVTIDNPGAGKELVLKGEFLNYALMLTRTKL
jgi:hypothetical protein